MESAKLRGKNFLAGTGDGLRVGRKKAGCGFRILKGNGPGEKKNGNAAKMQAGEILFDGAPTLLAYKQSRGARMEVFNEGAVC